MRQKMFLIATALLACSVVVVSPARAEKKEHPPGTVKYVASDVTYNEPLMVVSHDVACLDYAVPQVLLNPSSYGKVISFYPAGFSPEIRANVRGPTTVKNFLPRIRDKDTI